MEGESSASILRGRRLNSGALADCYFSIVPTNLLTGHVINPLFLHCNVALDQKNHGVLLAELSELFREQTNFHNIP